jgi:hypothetical protein
LEIIFNDFKGISTATRKPGKQFLAKCKNFELREKTGDLVMRSGYILKYAAPIIDATHHPQISNYLFFSFKTFSITTTGIPAEVTLLVGKGTISPDAGVVTPVMDIPLLFIRPYWDGNAWIDQWNWLNEMRIVSINSNIGGKYKMNGYFDDHVNFTGWTIINQSIDNQGRNYKMGGWDEVYPLTDFTHWVAGNILLLLKNFIPITELKAMYSATADDICFHNVLDGIRVGYGSYTDRIGLAVMYIKNSFSLRNNYGADTKSVFTFNEMAVQPYNVFPTTNYKFDLAQSGAVGNVDIASKAWYFRMTVMLDDYQEFYVEDSTITTDALADKILISFTIPIGYINKRVTSLRFFASQNPSGEERLSPYYLIYEYIIGTPVYQAGDVMISLDNLAPFTSIVLDSNMWQNRGAELNILLGYSATKIYVKSWQQAKICNKKVFALNPGTDELNVNRLFYNPTNALGEIHDVLASTSRWDLELFDGNDVIGIEKLERGYLFIGRKNGREIMNPLTGEIISSKLGNGISSKRGLVNLGETIAWPSIFDVFASDGSEESNISENFISDIYRNPAKFDTSTIISCRDKMDNSLIISDGLEGYEYVYTKRGWVQFKKALSPAAYDNDKDGILVFLSANNIYQYSRGEYSDLNEFGQVVAMDLEMLTVPIDADIIGESMPGNALFYLQAIWLFYKSLSNPLVLSVYLDGEISSYCDINFLAGMNLNLVDTHVIKTRPQPIKSGASCRTFQIGIKIINTASLAEVYSIGLIYDIIPGKL